MFKLLLGDPNALKLKRYQPIVSDINLLEEEVAPLSDEELRGLTTEFRGKLAALQLDFLNRGLRLLNRDVGEKGAAALPWTSHLG